MKILVVEDDRAIAQTLQRLFAGFNYAVDLAENGDAGLQMAGTFEYDLMVLDVMLTQRNGVNLCQELRAKGFQNPILLLTSPEKGQQQAIALKMGANDYVVKSFEMQELMARVQALLPRGHTTQQSLLTWGSLSLDTKRHQVTYRSQLLSLTPKEYAILELLLHTPQTPLSAKAILAHVWNFLDSPLEEAVRRQIRQLRRKLAAVGAPSNFIQTQRRAGYQLNPLYSSPQLPQTTESQALPQITELNLINEELRTTLEQLLATQTELLQKNQELAIAYQTLDRDRQELQVSRDELEQRVEERTTELRQREDFLSSVYDGVAQSIFVVDVTEGNDFRYVSFNRSAQEAVGMTLQEIQGKTPEEVFGLEVGQQFRQNYHRCLQADRSIQYESHFIFKNSPFWTLTTLAPLRNESGRIDRIVGTVLEITDRKQAEAALCESEAELRGMFNLTGVGMAQTDLATRRFLRVNAAFCTIAGYTEAELLNLTIDDINHPDDCDRDREQYNNLLQGKCYQSEKRYLRKDGSIVWVLATGNLIREPEGRPLRAFSMIQDISYLKCLEAEQQQAVQILHEAHQRIITIWENMTDAYTLLDLEWRITYTNSVSMQMLCQLTNLEPQDILGQSFWELFPSALGQPLEFEYRRAMSEQVPVHLEYLNLPTGDWIEVHAYPSAEGLGVYYRDITDRKKAEMALRDSEQKFRNMADHAPVMIWITDPTGVCNFVSRSWSEFTGQLEDGGLGFGWLDGVHPDDRERAKAIFLNSNESQEAFRIDYRLRRHDGEYCWVLDVASPWIGADGQFKGYIGSIVDISERKQAELEIRKFVSLADNSAEFIGMCDLNFIPFYVNPAGINLLGLEDVQSYNETPVRDFFFPEDGDFIIHEFFPRVLQEGQAEVEIRFRHFKTGEALWMVYSVFYIKDEDDRPIALATFSRNITDRKQAEQALRDSEQRLQAILDNSPAAIYLLDPQNNFLLVNRRCAELAAKTPAELLGRNIYEFWSQEIADTFAANNNQVLQTGQLLQIEEALPLADGMHTYITVKFPLCHSAGLPYAVCSISTDITEKKQLEAQFYRAQRLESLGTLASGISHDLNNVLTPILAIAQLLQLKHPYGDAQSQQMLKILENSAKRGSNLVQQILTFTRGTDGEQTQVSISSLLQEVIDVVKQTFPKSIDLHDTISNPLPWLVSADPTHLHQVFMNLCVNARDAMPNGGTLSLAIDLCFVDRTLVQTNLDAQVGNYVVVTIADTGTGIPPQVRDRIFDPFFTTKAPGEGTGLGLATVLGIVKNHGGFLQVFSEVGQGTQIEVYLPLIEGGLISSNQPKDPFQGKGEFILLVDDDAAVQLSTQSLLENYHYTVLSTNDGLKTIELYQKHENEIKLIVLDIMMPNISGISLIKKLRNLNVKVPIMALSGLSTNRDSALAAGANAFLTKPYTLSNFLEALQALMNLSLS